MLKRNGFVQIANMVSKVIIFVGLLFSIALLILTTSISTERALPLFGFFSIGMIVFVTTSDRIQVFGPAHILITYTILSCFSYGILVLIIGDPMYQIIQAKRHNYIYYFNSACALYYLGCCFLILGVTAKRNHRRASENAIRFSSKEAISFKFISKMIIYIFFAIITYNVLSGKMPLTDYSTIKEWFGKQSYISYALKLFSIALPTYVYFSSKKIDFIKILPGVAIPFLVLMLTGNRNDILMPVAIAVGTLILKRRYSDEKRVVPRIVVWASLTVVFFINPLISSTRGTGFGIDTLLSGNYGFQNALLEMGGQVAPFSILLSSLDEGSTAFMYGLTYLLPTISILSLSLIYSTSQWLNSDYNLTVLLNSKNHFGLGNSYFCEAYMNFGIIGMVLVPYILGLYLGRMEQRTLNERRRLFYLQIMPMVMIWSRGTFNLNIVTIILAILFNSIVTFIANGRMISRKEAAERTACSKSWEEF